MQTTSPQAQRILVVEDDSLVAAVLVDMLEELGCTVVDTARSAGAAVSAARRHHPDVVVMDVNLAGPSDGIEAARAIHRDEPAGIVFVTGHMDARTRERAHAAVPCSYLLKPVEPAELGAALRKAA
jgi:two-component system, response regulator PdtaR